MLGFFLEPLGKNLFLILPQCWEPLLIATGGSIPLLCLKEFHDLRGTLQDEAGFMRKFETTHVGGAKC